jgi:LysM repeat protein
MLKKSSLILLFALVAILLLVSCQRSASQAPVTSVKTPTGISATATGKGTPLSQIEIIQTQTAAGQPTSLATPVIIIPTETAVSTVNPFVTVVPPTGTASTPVPGNTPVIIVPVATPGVPTTYNLQKGEQPYCIARRFNVNQNDLLTLNGLTNANATDLPEGYSLRIPQSGNPFIGARVLFAHPTTYTVSSSNETIYSIACHFGDVDPTQIIAANGLTSPYILHINQVLSIP